MKKSKAYPPLSALYYVMLTNHYDADMVYKKLLQWISNHPTQQQLNKLRDTKEEIFHTTITTELEKLIKYNKTFKDYRIKELLEYALENSIIKDEDLITSVYTILTTCCKCYDFDGKAKYIFNDFSDHLDGLHYTYVYIKRLDSFRYETIIRTGEFIVHSLDFLVMFAKDFSANADYVWEENKDEKIHKFNSYLKSHCNVF